MASYFNQLALSNATYDVNDARISTDVQSSSATNSVYIKAANTLQTNSNGGSGVIREDGTAECGKAFSFSSVSISSGTGYSYVGTPSWTEAERTYPVTFSALPSISMTPESSDYNFGIASKMGGTVSVMPQVYLVRPYNTTGTASGKIYVGVVGSVA